MSDAGGRDERVTDLYFVQSPSPGDPTVDGQVRLNASGDDLLAYLDGVVKSLTTGSPVTTDRAWRRHFLLMGC